MQSPFVRTINIDNYFFILLGGRFVVSDVIVPEPKGPVRLREPSERLVTVSDPNGRVIPVVDFPLRYRSVEIVPFPNGCERVVVPSDQ